MTDLVLSRDVTVVMRDGVVLRADVWRGLGSPPGPALLVRTPYLKEAMAPSVQIDPRRAADRGLAVVVQDVRGTGTSQGVFTPFASETADGADTVAWLRDQPWCDGRVVMAGMSYVGATQWLAAKARPEGLVAIAPTLTSDEFGDGWTFRNGVLELGFVASWSVANLAPMARRWFDEIERAYRDHGDVAEIAPWFPTWLTSAPDDGYWRALSVARPLPGGELPALVTAGWYDIFGAASIRSFQRHAHPYSRLVLGPWGHDPDLSHLVGDRNVGFAGAGMAWDFSGRLLDWYRAVLDGRDPPGPRVSAFLLESGRWVDLDDWPPPGAEERVVRLEGGGTIVVDPARLPPTVDGNGLRVLVPGWGFGIRDYRAHARREDVMALRLPTLETPQLWVGPVSADLRVEASGGDRRQWTAVLCIERPGGPLHNLAEGVAEASTDADRVTVPLGHVGAELPAGTQLVLLVGGGSWPRWRPPADPGRQTVLTGSELRFVALDHL